MPHGTGVADERAHLQEAAVETALLVGGVLGDEGGGAAVLTARGEALDEAEEDEQDGRPEADGGVGRDQADAEGAQRHHDHGEGEDLLAADTVAERAEVGAAQGAYEERHGEGGERRQQLGGVAAAGEEHVADGDREIAVDPEVEPFHGVTERGGLHGAFDDPLVGDGDIGAPQFGVLAPGDGTEEHPVALERFPVLLGNGVGFGAAGRHEAVLSVGQRGVRGGIRQVRLRSGARIKPLWRHELSYVTRGWAVRSGKGGERQGRGGM